MRYAFSVHVPKHSNPIPSQSRFLCLFVDGILMLWEVAKEWAESGVLQCSPCSKPTISSYDATSSLFHNPLPS